MKRIFAFLIDHAILSFVLVFAAIPFIFISPAAHNRSPLMPGLPFIWVLWMSYFVAADYFFEGMTIGKRLLGMRPVRNPKEGAGRLGWALAHTFLKWLFAAFWPLGLIVYVCCGGKMPYDRRLGIAYESEAETGERRNSGWKTIARIGVAAVAFMAILIVCLTLILQRMALQPHYSLKTEKVASLTSVLGRYRLASYSSSSTTDSVKLKYQYDLEREGGDLAEQYAGYLSDKEGFVRFPDEEAYQENVLILKKDSSDGVYKITVYLKTVSDQLLVELHCDEKSGIIQNR
ncbi:RDD family protein [Clostridium sp. AN503]|uniref:RDD family protein n=1 Tax=Clostridium sp. AN503 TaxID=3160598 RepID=UPI0034578485